MIVIQAFTIVFNDYSLEIIICNLDLSPSNRDYYLYSSPRKIREFRIFTFLFCCFEFYFSIYHKPNKTLFYKVNVHLHLPSHLTFHSSSIPNLLSETIFFLPEEHPRIPFNAGFFSLSRSLVWQVYYCCVV